MGSLLIGNGVTAAHTPRHGSTQWHLLSLHLSGVADLATTFARAFSMPRSAYFAGLVHDLGKVNPAFQQYLQDEHAGIKGGPKVPHSAWGAAFAVSRLKWNNDDWPEAVLPVLGHHAGLPQRATCVERMRNECESFRTGDPLASKMLDFVRSLPVARTFRTEIDTDPLRRELLLRMLFSALVDADRLDTEHHFNPNKRTIRRGWWPLASLWSAFRRDHVQKMAGRRGSGNVNRVRREVYRHCLRAARCKTSGPGVYRLAVPTGGGKTRCALAFALAHAHKHRSHGFRRVVFALPFTSIVDQTVQEYRSIFPSAGSVVLEHHSQIELQEDERKQSGDERRRQLAEENWDAPLIVTTTVQLFESLLSDKPGRCRKIHNVARSIIILDEVQALPSHVLEPTLSVLRCLAERCGTTVVLCTATQPVFEDTPYLKAFARKTVTPIVPAEAAAKHFQELQRVTYERREGRPTWKELAAELATDDARQVMVIVNTRRDALRLLDALKEAGATDMLHLSTLLCGAHRRRVLAEVRRRLAAGEAVRLVSTQVVEAGVDVDFPLVYRALAPLDRIIQAAGRCNREGRPQKGRVVIFDPAEGAVPPGEYFTGSQEAGAMLRRATPDELHNPDFCRQYFARMFGNLDMDKHRIQSLRKDMNYPEVGRLYRLIEQDTVPVVAPSYDKGEGRGRLDRHLIKPSRSTWRRLQPYLVNLYQHEADRLQSSGWLTEAGPSLLVWEGTYEDQPPHRGMLQAILDPADLTTLTLEEAGWSI